MYTKHRDDATERAMRDNTRERPSLWRPLFCTKAVYTPSLYLPPRVQIPSKILSNFPEALAPNQARSLFPEAFPSLIYTATRTKKSNTAILVIKTKSAMRKAGM